MTWNIFEGFGFFPFLCAHSCSYQKYVFNLEYNFISFVSYQFKSYKNMLFNCVHITFCNKISIPLNLVDMCGFVLKMKILRILYIILFYLLLLSLLLLLHFACFPSFKCNHIEVMSTRNTVKSLHCCVGCMYWICLYYDIQPCEGK